MDKLELRKLHTLGGCLKQFEKIKYESFGFPYVFLDYSFTNKTWGVIFRNPVNFDNPKIKEKTPLKACHKMIDFLNQLKK